MQNLLDRSVKMQQAFNSPQPPHKRYRDAMAAAIDQLVLTGLPRTFRRTLERQLSAMNPILQKYPIKTFDDYALISSAHIDQLLEYARKIHRLFVENCD